MFFKPSLALLASLAKITSDSPKAISIKAINIFGEVPKCRSKYLPSSPSVTAGVAVANPTVPKKDRANTKLFFIYCSRQKEDTKNLAKDQSLFWGDVFKMTSN